MLNFFICMIISMSLSYGFSILIVEKSDKWPLRKRRIQLQLLVRKIHYKAPQALKCQTCTSFWASAGADVVVGAVAMFFGVPYFFWPFSGMITAGATWTVIEMLNSLEKQQNINLVIGENSENKGD
jgi:hypothetical protein